MLRPRHRHRLRQSLLQRCRLRRGVPCCMLLQPFAVADLGALPLSLKPTYLLLHILDVLHEGHAEVSH